MRTTTILKTIGITCFMFIAALFISCEGDEDEDVTGGGSDIEGVWVRLPGPSGDRTEIAVGGIDGESSDRVYMCEKKGSTAAGFYKGTLNGNVVTWDSSHNLPDAHLSRVGGELELDYPDCEVCLPTRYKSGSWSGECTIGGGGGNPGGGGGTTGQVMFWVKNDFGCGMITVNIAGESGLISGYYSSGAPGCGGGSAANFTLPAGNYNYNASCDGLTWNGSVTVTANGCFKMQLTQ